jgi:tetratricopeptide (TPR) repeat protein
MKYNTAEMRQNIALTFADISSILGRYDTCIALYDYLITQKPDSAEYYGKKAAYLHLTGRYEETIIALDGAISRDPNNADYLLRKARLTRALNRMPESNATYERIDQLAPQTAIDFVYTGDANLDRSRYLQALDRYTSALSLEPTDARTWEKRGDVIFALLTIPTAGLLADESLRNRDLYSEGIRSYENAMNLNPDLAREIRQKMEKRSDIFVSRSIAELESRYTRYRYLG